MPRTTSTAAVTLRNVATLTKRKSVSATDDGDGRNGPQGDDGADCHRECRVVVGREVDGENLGQVTPLGYEDHNEGSDDGPVSGRLLLGELLFIFEAFS